MLIRPEEMKYLLKNLQILKAAHDSMKRGLESLAADVDGEIYSACMNGPVTGGGLPGIGTISDKTGRIAINLDYSSRENVKQFQRDINLLANVIESVHAGMEVLTNIQKSILRLRYPEDGAKVAWKDITSELNISVSHIRKIFDFSIARMIAASQIPVETFQEIILIMEGRGG